jgi:glycosyltransferase involved in cell wall biosynthesis
MFVSVVTPNYNHEIYLKQRLETILNQTFSGKECIVLDDSSSDNSTNIIELFSKNNEFINIVFNTYNSGSTFSQWNKGVSFAKTNLIWIAESDDYADSAFLESVSKPILEQDDVVLSFCQSNVVDEFGVFSHIWNNNFIDSYRLSFEHDFIMDGLEFVKLFLIHKNVIPNASAVVFRKDIYEKIGGADESLKTNGDWLVWLKMLCYGKVAFIAKPLNYFRRHSESVIGKINRVNIKENYVEQYDRLMRLKFYSFVKHNKIKIEHSIIYSNNTYISFDNGNEAIFLFRKRKYFKALKLVFFATFYPNFKTGYIKQLFSFK